MLKWLFGSLFEGSPARGRGESIPDPSQPKTVEFYNSYPMGPVSWRDKYFPPPPAPELLQALALLVIRWRPVRIKLSFDDYRLLSAYKNAESRYFWRDIAGAELSIYGVPCEFHAGPTRIVRHDDYLRVYADACYFGERL